MVKEINNQLCNKHNGSAGSNFEGSFISNSKVSQFWAKVKQIIPLSNTPIYMYAVIVLIGYIFYQLGYSFMFGLYFGGSSQFPKLMDILINQVPFDFKFLSVLGIIIFICCICYYTPLHMYLTVDKLGIKLIWLIIHTIALIGIVLLYSIVAGLGENEILYSNILQLLIITSGLIVIFLFMLKFMIAIMSETIINSIKKILLAVFYLVALLIVNVEIIKSIGLDIDKNITLFTSIIAVQIVFFVGLLDYLIFTNHDKNKQINVFLKFFNWIPVVIMFITFSNIGKFVLAILILLVLYKRQKKKKLSSNQINSIQKVPAVYNKKSTKGVASILLLLLLICGVTGYLIVYSIVYAIGNSIGENSTLNSQSLITYNTMENNQELKVVKGVVVAQGDNIYYISSEKRELIVISSLYVSIQGDNSD